MGSLGLGRGADTRVKTRGERLQQGSIDDRCGGAHSQGVEEVSNTAGVREWRPGTGCTLRDTELKNGASRIVFCSHFLGATHINLIC